MMKKILIINGRYLPGYKDGGPVRSIKNLVDYLGTEYQFYILTADRDHGDLNSYPNIVVNEWNQVGNAFVYYVPPKGFTKKMIRKLADGKNLIYVCGCFNDYAINTMLLKRNNKIKIPVVIASMGLFSPKEFAHKRWKKQLFVTAFRLLGMFKNIYWSVTSIMEIEELHQATHIKKDCCLIAEDLPRVVQERKIMKNKEKGCIDVVWISRITYKKNLIYTLQLLALVKCNVNLSIYGPIQDETYWKKCKEVIEILPKNVSAEYKGNIESENVVKILEQYHVFLFPTLGENYGHVIQEALSAGCPCILSDQTPWKDLEEKQVGYVYPLGEDNRFVDAVEKYGAMEQDEFQLYVNKCLDYAISNSNSKVKNTGYRVIFELE